MDYPELEGNSSIEEIVSDDNDEIEMQEHVEEGEDEEQEQENNCLDATYIHEGDQPMNYEGIMEGNISENDHHYQVDPHEEYTSTLALKRNLSATFEKHAAVISAAAADEYDKRYGYDKNQKMKRGKATTKTAAVTVKALSSNTDRNGVKAKIKVFEQKKVLIQPKPKETNNSHKVRFENNANNANGSRNSNNNNRPPTAPIPQRIVASSSSSAATKDSNAMSAAPSDVSLLSVYLRIRPPSASEDAINESEEACHNTVEVLSPTTNGDNVSGEQSTATATTAATVIRTYPPIQSNASKVVRGQGQLHSTSHNTDLIFNGSNSNKSSVDGTVKGVKEFNFNQVFATESTQEEIYEHVAVPLVDGLFPKDENEINLVGDKLVGKSALLFSYGITNAGKTYTIMGTGKEQSCNSKKDVNVDNIGLEESHGIIPRTIDHLLSKMKAMENENVKYQLNLSYLEIYNEQIYDLLPIEEQKGAADANAGKKYPGGRGPRSFPMEQAPLRIRESRNGRIYVRGLAKHNVASFARGIELVSKAKNKRRTSSNRINSDSSRSHSICQFELVAVPASLNHNNNEINNDVDSVSVSTTTSSLGGYNTDDDSSVQSKRSQKRSVTFWVVDLAGSERSKRTGAFSRSTRQKEAALINSSLMKLMRCLQTLRQNQQSKSSSSSSSHHHNASVVPFRESKLTHLFMGHLTSTSASRTSMIVNINPSIADFDETQHVLSYATVARSIRISQSDYNRKRQAIQMIGTNKTADVKNGNGGKQKAEFKSPPRKIARMVQKLSPRAALARMREQKEQKEQQKSNHVKRREELENLRGTKKATATTTSTSDNILKKKKDFGGKVKFGRSRQDEINELRSALAKSQAEVEDYQSEATELRTQLAQCEANIRRELYEETEQYHKCIHDQHNEIVNRLKQQIAAASQTPSKSAMKVQRDKADVMIDELMDKVDECEEEMERMTESHREEITKLKETHSLELLKRDEEIGDLRATLEKRIEEDSREIEELKADLAYKSKIIAELDGENEEGESTNTSDHDKENGVNYSSTGPSPRLRRLPRKRCSEVACANVSPPNDNKVSSSSKKQRKKRSPFKPKNAHGLAHGHGYPTRSTNHNESNDVIFPSVKAEYDDLTGSYHRPEGRAPPHRIWDAKVGGWRVSRAGMQ